MSVPDYMPEPETVKEKAAAHRRARLSRPGVFSTSFDRGPAPAFGDMAAILAFEREHPDNRVGGPKEHLIQTTFNVRAAKYYSRLVAILHDPDQLRRALELDSTTVNRLLDRETQSTEHRRRRAEGMSPQ